ncbi:MAG: hypothetical protein LBQ14_00585 [Treponema sp.]|jgi:hypothetical protein|nr:hypothetical protein [Treponema sp.]
MKKKLAKIGIAVLTAMTALAIIGCPQNVDPDEGSAKNDAAAVSAISVAGVSVATVPQPITAAEWASENFDVFSVSEEQLGTVRVQTAAALTDAAIEVTASPGAVVKFALADLDVPAEFAADSTLTISTTERLCIQVTSENGNTVNYYVVEIKLASANVTLSEVTVGDVTATLGTPNEDYSQAVAGTANLGANLTGIQVTVTKGQSGQTVQFAKVTGGGDPVFAETAAFDFADGDILYIEVTAENGVKKNIYKIEIWGIRSAVPIISPEELPNATYQVGEASPAALTVTVSLPDLEEIPVTSTITYQWYSNTQDSNTGGTPIENETTESFTPPTGTVGRAWYYVAVTHSDTTVVAAPATAVSTPARISIVTQVEKVESIVSGSSNTVAYRFTLPEGKNWSDYTKITWQVLVDDLATINMAATRAHIVGNYQANVFNTTNGEYQKLSDWNVARLVTISNGGNMSLILGTDYVAHTWKTLSYSIAEDNSLKDGSYDEETYYPAANAAGPFYFGIGLSVNPNNNANGVCRYFVRGMALSNEDGTEVVYADDLNTQFGETNLTLMDLKCIFNQSTQIQRSLVNNPVPDEEE